MPHLIKLYVHVEADLFRVALFPSARRRTPETRPPWLTPNQRALWRALTGCEAGAAFNRLLKHGEKLAAVDTQMRILRYLLESNRPGWELRTFESLEQNDACWRVIVNTK